MDALTRPLIAWTDRGLYCEAGDFYIDPHRPVDTAVVTHAHSDHARRGSRRYLCASESVGLMKCRLGSRIQIEGIPYGVPFQLGSVRVSFHSAGHILGSAQVRVEHEGEVWVASGDYKRDPDPSCEPFESVRCDVFITEATFGTPKYAWEKGRQHGREIHEWWKEAAASGKNCVLFGYSLGKAQRILAELAPFADKPVLIHRSAGELTQCYRDAGQTLAPTVELDESADGTAFRGELILAPPSILKADWSARLGEYETAFASGWMQPSSHGKEAGGAHGRSYDRGFVISDHADWNDLNRSIDESGARRVFVQHRNGILVRHLRKRGIDAHPASALDPADYGRLPQWNLSLL